MRFSPLLAALAVAVPLGLGTTPASADAYDAIFGGRARYEGPWCSQVNMGAGQIVEDCRFNSIEACRKTVISGNRGFCTQNPSFTGFKPRPPRKQKRQR